MNRSLLLLCLLLLGFAELYSQAPQGINYQAVVRGNTGNLQINQTLGVRFSIEDGNNTVYQELHNTTSNGFGLIELVIGRGTPLSGTFNGVPWSQGPYFLKVEIDDGTGFQNLGTTELVSVPFALYAETASSVENITLTDLDDVTNQAPLVGQVLKWDGSSWIPQDDLQEDGDIDSANEIQNLSISGNIITLNNGGGSVTLPPLNLTVGPGLDFSGGVLTNSGDTDASDDITIGTVAGGDLGGTYPDPTVTALQGQTISNTPPAANQVLAFVNGQWEAADDNSLFGAAAGGDLSGTYPDPTVSGIQGNSVANTAPASGQVLKWNGSQWAPADDNSGSSVWTLNGTNAYYNSGDVGIGTTDPEGSFEVRQNSSLSDPHILLHENGNDYARMRFQNNNGSNYWSIAAYIASNNRNDRLNFWNGTSGDVMTITGDGEVGIGVGISPKVAFHVGNQRRILFGTDTLGNGDKLMFLPDLHAFRVGTVATGAASTYWNRDSIGLYSFASGLNTRAQGFGATAMGRDTEATNSYAFASGFFTNADGQYSTAMGFNTDAFALGSTALGYSTDAEANYSFAAGYFAEAQAIYSIAIGNAVRAQSFASMAVGRYNIGGGSATSWVSSDPIFEIGIGTGPSSRANAVTVRKNGNVGIGTTVPLDRLHVNGRVRLQTVEYFEDGGTSEIAVRGDVRPSADNTYDVGTSTFRYDDVFATSGVVNTSDMRDKENILPIPYGLDEVMKLNPVIYNWKEGPDSEAKLGLLAQDLIPILKEVVKTHNYEVSEEDESLTKVKLDRLGVYYSDIIPVLIKATQEQQDIIKKQQELIEQMEIRLQKLENKE
ncbi:MAG: tail fiber domain-containing protein [Bacteroidia bacterium]|nr:tail fiber domain-containing protein [Bacteroidia bacterium]